MLVGEFGVPPPVMHSSPMMPGSEQSWANEAMFGLGRGNMMPGAEGATTESGGDMFGFGDIVETETAKTIRDLANFAAAVGGAVVAFSMVGKDKPTISNVGFGALGAGLGVMALVALGLVTKQIKV